MDDTTAKILEVLRTAGLELEAGLSEAELSDTERTFGFRFPPDLRALLAAALPEGWADWRRRVEVLGNGEVKPIEWGLDWPIRGTLFDIEHNAFWWEKWGPKPASLPEAFVIAERSMRSAPRLIPLFSHRYIPSEPSVAGNLVLSIHQTDIVVYGEDLLDYVCHEFNQPRPAREMNESATTLPYWGGFLEAAWKARYESDDEGTD